MPHMPPFCVHDSLSEMEGTQEDKDVSKLFLKLMEGYSDSVIAPLSEFSPSRGTDFNRRAASSSRPPHQQESSRRVHMNRLFATLQSMVPNLFHKDTKVKNLKIVDETIAYIKELEECLEGLKQRKAVVEAAAVCLPTHRNASSSVDVTVSGKVWFFGVRSKVVRRGLVNDIFTVFNRHGAEVLGASVAVHEQELRLTVTALVDNDTINGAAANFVADTIKTDLILLLLIPPGI